MSPGNSNKRIDRIIDQLNHKIAWILGKRNRVPNFNKKSSTSSFVLVLILAIIFLWGLSGIYYLKNNQIAIVLRAGKVNRVLKNSNFGLVWPYPIEIINSIDLENKFLTIGLNAPFIVYTKDLQALNLSLNYNFQLKVPQKYFINYSQDDINPVINWQLEPIILQFIAKFNLNQLLSANMIVLSNQLQTQINNQIVATGFKIDKLNLKQLSIQTSTQQATKISINNNNQMESELAIELLNQAHAYQQNTETEAQVKLQNYQALLKQYQLNKNSIVEEMYYQALSQIPVTKKNNYPLLTMSLFQLLVTLKSKNNSLLNTASIDDESRNLEREVTRARTTGAWW